jgi:hypothetical protein
MTSLAFAKWSALVLSTKVIARLKKVIFPFKIPATNSSEVVDFLRNFWTVSTDRKFIVSGDTTPAFSCKADDFEFGFVTMLLFER